MRLNSHHQPHGSPPPCSVPLADCARRGNEAVHDATRVLCVSFEEGGLPAEVQLQPCAALRWQPPKDFVEEAQEAQTHGVVGREMSSSTPAKTEIVSTPAAGGRTAAADGSARPPSDSPPQWPPMMLFNTDGNWIFRYAERRCAADIVAPLAPLAWRRCRGVMIAPNFATATSPER